MGWMWSYYRHCSFLAALAVLATVVEGQAYLGTRIGPLSELQHQVKGDLYAVDSRTLHIRGFSYDGAAPDAFFYAGSSPRPSDSGFIIPDENGGVKPLGRYRNQDVTLTLPDGKTFKDIRWISIWCREFAIDFGSIAIPTNLDYPRPQKIDALPTLEHGVSSDRIVVVDAQTFLIPNFSYDGAAPDGHFWVGKGTSPGAKGTVVPDENGSEEPLKRYSSKTIVITLPGDLTVFDIDFLSVWCKAFLANFGHVRIPKNLNVPPSLKMLGVAPQTKLNCEVLWDDLAFEVRWAVAGESIVMQLVGRITDGQYMAFGASGSSSRSVMIGGDVIVAWLDQATGRGEAKDYALSAKAQCQGGRGACPDDKIQGSNNNVRLLNAALINDFTMLTFQRPLKAVDSSDVGILTNGSQAVIWAIGPVNSQGDTSYHTLRSRGDMFVDFGRTPRWNCPLPEEQGSNTGGPVAKTSGPSAPPTAKPASNPWFIPPVPCYEPEDGVFYAQIGPTGGENGYNSITGHVGWGIAWYINGLLIPEINVVRGKTYTFVVEGGFDPEHPARYHPFYITDDSEGGYEFKTPAERSRIRVFAGVGQDRDGSPVPTAYGRLCEWSEDPNQPSGAFDSFGAYQRTLQLDCQEGQPGILQWTPDVNTPDTVYYQCYTHRFLGWKINVVDQCNEQIPAGSEVNPTIVSAPDPDYAYYDDFYDVQAPDDTRVGGSLRHETNFHTDLNRIPAIAKLKKRPQTLPTRPDQQRFPDHFSFPDFPYDFPSGFEPFPYDLEQDSFDGSSHHRPSKPSIRPSNPPPLGAPGFTFPKLPNLKNPTSIVDANAFAKLGNRTDISDFSKPFNDFDFSAAVDIPTKPMSNQYPLKSEISIETDFPNKPISNQYPLKQSSTSITQQPPSAVTPKFTPPRRSSISSTQLSSTTSAKSPSTAATKQPFSRATSKPQSTLKETSSLAPFHQLTHSLGHSSFQTTPSHQPTQSLISTPFHQGFHSKSTVSTKVTTTSQPVTAIRQIPTRQTVPLRKTETSVHSSQSSYITKSPLQGDFKPPFKEPDVITAPSLPRLPGQLPPRLDELPLIRQTPRYTSPLPKSSVPPKIQNIGPAFAQSFGFDPDSIVYESDFRPVKQKQPGPTLAFEVSSSNVKPIRIPRPPRLPHWSSHRHPGGPRTSGPFGFAQRISEVDVADSDEDKTTNDFPNSSEVAILPPDTLGPIFYPSVAFSKNVENNPIPLPVAMGSMVPLLGGGASNEPSKPNHMQQLPPMANINSNSQTRLVRPPPESVGRLGIPQFSIGMSPAKRLVTSHVSLPDNHAVPVPQLVGFLKPLYNFPVETEDLTAAASAQVFASDGRPLSPDSVPEAPRLPTRPRRPSHQITNRPQVVPFRGPLPPPVPSQVPHLTQFNRQRRPVSRPTTVPPPPLQEEFLNPGRLESAGSNQQTSVIAHVEVPVVAAALSPHQQLTADIGNNEVISVNQNHHTTAEAYAPARSPVTHTPNPEEMSTKNNQTRINILKDVWAILTMEDHDLKPEHPRDDAHPDHDHGHLDRQERKKREAEDAKSSSSVWKSSFSCLVVTIALALGR